MKKSLFFVAAASALMLTACSSESDVLQTATQPQTTVQQQTVGFDVYTPAATNVTRSGQHGIMTTSRIQRPERYGGGFGVYAFLTEDKDTDGADVKYESTTAGTANVPNFMVNEKLLWNEESQGWYYNPLKYWPNETDNDSQAKEATMNGTHNHTDRLTFFAYAPYVSEDDGSGTGITHLTDKEGKINTYATTDPTVDYKAVLDNPNNGVDLLWGVAPAGGLNYTAVNGNYVSSPEGFPLKDMIKPNVNTNMKFLFQHALARLNVKAVAAIDQIGAGGTLDPNTRITINKITITGPFGLTGRLNLNNSVKDVANWIKINDVDIKNAANAKAFTDANQTITITANESTPAYNGIAKHLRYVGTHASPEAQTERIGVTTVLQNVLEPAVYSKETPWVSYKTYAAGESFDYSETTPYYTDEDCEEGDLAEAAVVLRTGSSAFTIDSKGVLTELAAAPTGIKYPKVNVWYDGKLEKFPDAAAATAANTAGTQAYAYNSTTKKYTPITIGTATAEHYRITTALKKATIEYKNSGSTAKNYYKRDANYYMIVPTNNIPNVCDNISTYEEALRTLTVSIEYYITTEDTNLNGGIVQTKNVVKKDVVFPSIANGKSYNLNLILGLTSVKFEAEVDDWRVINVNGDLPQNTGE